MKIGSKYQNFKHFWEPAAVIVVNTFCTFLVQNKPLWNAVLGLLSSTCCLLYFRGIVVPNHDSPMGSYGNNVVSIGRVTSFGNRATFSFALGDQRTLLVSPDLEKKIRKNNLQTSWNKKITYSLHMRITYVFGLRIQIHAMCIVFSSSSKSRSRLYS